MGARTDASVDATGEDPTADLDATGGGGGRIVKRPFMTMITCEG